MPKKPAGDAPSRSWFPWVRRTVHHPLVRTGWRRFQEEEVFHRSLGFAALGFLTLVPLLIVVSAAGTGQGRGFAQWLGEGLGVTGASQREIERLFARPGQVLRTTTALGLASLAVFGLTFGTAVQTGYEKIWELPPARWHARWRHVVWVGVLIGYLLLSALGPRWLDPPASVLAAALSAVLFFWWSQWLLLSGRVGWGAVLPGAIATVVGLIGLRGFSVLVFSPLIASNAVTYGPFGTVLVIQSWLVGVGVVVFGGALVGRLLYEEFRHDFHDRDRPAWPRH
ncbi:YhjD/YihY/BrkB family envelope integrity protein [Streptomyces palmae]|uniref:Ribonuclease BN n=1 Tax=Streptomyces palmae TaxID=1701085 RepID=A0A4Z0FNH7_9ACTN|nr:YhjD/YihY/BrkB family envelope integrity protein [Streptomyces palmae]TGA83208.1 ribonuclease BN [Streptomyces palmae]